MRRMILLMAVQVWLCTSIFAQGYCERDQCYYAEVNGASFQFRDYWPVSTQLIRQQGSLDGRIPGRKVITILFNGVTLGDSVQGRQFDESIELEINYDELNPTQADIYTIALHYKNGVYSALKTDTALKISGFKWEPNRDSFRLTAEINCRMHQWSTPLGSENDVLLKAHIENALVTVPGWLLGKN